jgi:hypothetical protein
MGARGSGWLLAAALLGGLGCNARALDPGVNPMDPTMTGTGGSNPPPDPVVTPDLVSQLRMVAGPDQLLIVGVNGGAVTSVSTHGPIHQFVNDPERLVEAAAVVGMKVCSVELQTLALGLPGDGAMLAVPDALDMCLKEDLGDMPARIAELRTPSMVVVVASNAAITVRSTNGGINYFYGTDIVDLLHAAREVYVPVCFVMTGALALPTPEGQSAGASIDEALAACGRS